MNITYCNDIYVYDKDGKEYIDTRFGAGSFILGHTKEFNNQIFEQINKGILFGYPSVNEIDFKNTLQKTLSWYDEFIFCSSGSESIMKAFRIARSFTKKTKIAILSSFWHGGYDGTQVENYYPDVKIISSSGITENHIDELILLPNNDNKKCFEILIKNKDDIAMVFCEPVQQIVPHINIELLKELRKFTKENKILFGFDEMITGFRLALGGAQEYLNIYSDIACYGKIIGGGYPIGIIAINKEINDHIETVQPSIRFGGTFSGNPLSTYTGNLVLNYLIENKSDIYAKINNLTKRLCDKINEFSQVNNFSIQFCYVGSFYRIIFTDKNITSMEERKKYELNNIKQKQFYNILIENNLITAANPLSFISYKHTESDIDRISEIYKKSIINFFQ